MRQKLKAERGRLEGEEIGLAGKKETLAKKTAETDAAGKALARMTAELALLEQALRDLKAARERDRQTYSVIPYHGRRGETCRPFYVECMATGLVFHPDRKVLVMPAPYEIQAEVDRRIAAQNERTARRPHPRGPHPLPPAAGAAGRHQQLLRSARGSQGAHTVDYGYEFVDADWVLDFPADEGAPAAQPWMTLAPPVAAPAAARDAAAPPGKPLAAGLSPLLGGPAIPGAGGGSGGKGSGIPGGTGGGGDGAPGGRDGRERRASASPCRRLPRGRPEGSEVPCRRP